MVTETFINFIEAARLKGVGTDHFIVFKQLQEVYYTEIEKKSRQLQEDIMPTSNKSSIKDDALGIFVAAKWIEASAVDGITK